MSKIKLVVEVDEEMYQFFKETNLPEQSIYKIIAKGTPIAEGDMISRSELIKTVEKVEGISWERHDKDDMCVRKKYIDNAPTVELTETEVQEVLNKRCMTAVANEYLIALHGKTDRPKGEWYYSCDKGWECNQCHKTVKDMPIDDNKKATYNFCPNCGADMRGDDNGKS